MAALGALFGITTGDVKLALHYSTVTAWMVAGTPIILFFAVWYSSVVSTIETVSSNALCRDDLLRPALNHASTLKLNELCHAHSPA